MFWPAWKILFECRFSRGSPQLKKFKAWMKEGQKLLSTRRGKALVSHTLLQLHYRIHCMCWSTHLHHVHFQCMADALNHPVSFKRYNRVIHFLSISSVFFYNRWAQGLVSGFQPCAADSMIRRQRKVLLKKEADRELETG